MKSIKRLQMDQPFAAVSKQQGVEILTHIRLSTIAQMSRKMTKIGQRWSKGIIYIYIYIYGYYFLTSNILQNHLFPQWGTSAWLQMAAMCKGIKSPRRLCLHRLNGSNGGIGIRCQPWVWKLCDWDFQCLHCWLLNIPGSMI